MPSYTVRILFLARAYSNFSLRRMQQQLNIADVRKLLHTKDVKGDSIIGYSDRWPFVPYLSKLIPYDLIPFQVECTQFTLSVSKYTPTGFARPFSIRIVEIQSTRFLAKRETLLVTIRSYSPRLHASIIAANCSLFFNDVPEIPSSAAVQKGLINLCRTGFPA